VIDYYCLKTPRWGSFLGLFNPFAAVDLFFKLLCERPSGVLAHNFMGAISPLGFWVLCFYKTLLDKDLVIAVTLHDYSLFWPSSGHFIYDDCGVSPVPLGADFKSYSIRQLDIRGFLFGSAKLLRWLMIRPLVSLDAVNAFLAPSEFMLRAAEGKIDSEKLFFLPNPVVVDSAVIRAGLTRAPHDSRAVRIGFFGRNADEKGLARFVDELSEVHQKITLSMFSGVTEEGRLDLWRRVHGDVSLDFRGAVPHAAVQAEIETFDCVCVPSVWYENAPMIVSESLSVGTPVIVRDIGALSRLPKKSDRVFAYSDSASLAELIATVPHLPRKASALPGETFSEYAAGLAAIFASQGARL